MGKEQLIIDARGTTRDVFQPKFTPETPQDNIILFPDKKEVHIDWRSNFDAIDGIKERIEAAEIVQDEGTYQVKLDYPKLPYVIGLNFSDAHIGAYTSDHGRIKQILEYLTTTPNSFLVDAGDTFNNGVWGGLAYEDVLPPYMQQFTVGDIIREFGDKYAAAVIGNHPEWLFNSAGVKPEFMFAKEMKGVVFPGMGLLHVKAGDQSYDWALAHTYWGKSKINIFNCCIRLREKEYPDTDIITIGHEHIWGYLKERVAGRDVLYIRPGTAKTKDRYARIHGIAKRGQEMGVAVVFRTDRHEFDAMPIDRAVEFMHEQSKLAGY
jgi:hypothetical protein